MTAQNLTYTGGIGFSPFSMQEIQQYFDFFDHSKPLGERGNWIAKNIICTNIIAYFYRRRLGNLDEIKNGSAEAMTLSKIVNKVACWGMPPNYLRRFNIAYDIFRQTRHPGSWQSFLDQVRRDRAAANVVFVSSFDM